MYVCLLVSSIAGAGGISIKVQCAVLVLLISSNIKCNSIIIIYDTVIL
jgi:hypothetical protein